MNYGKPKPEYIERKDGRVELRGQLYHRMRVELCRLADNKCEGCGATTPLQAGEAHHANGRGGGRRDDRIMVKGKRNLKWYCKECHRGKHVPAKVVPKKLDDAAFKELMGL